MGLWFIIVNGLIGTTGSYLVFKKFRHLGLLLAGLCCVIGSIWSGIDSEWMPMMGLTAIGALLARLVGNPLEL